MPSVWYEAFGLVVIEAFASGRPVIVSGHGSLRELVNDGETGWHTTPGDPVSLASAMNAAWARPSEAARRGHNARLAFERDYESERNYDCLMRIYNVAIKNKHTWGTQDSDNTPSGGSIRRGNYPVRPTG